MKMLMTLLLTACLSCTPKLVKEKVITIGPGPQPTPLITVKERVAAASVAAAGKAMGVKIDEQGAQAKSPESKINLDFWDTIYCWLATPTVPPPELNLDTVELLKGRLSDAVRERQNAEEEYRKAIMERERRIADLESKNILVAKEKEEVNSKLGTLAKENSEYGDVAKKLSWAGVGVAGVVGALFTLFAYIRFGKTIGTLVLVIGGAFYVGGIMVFLWSFYKTFVVATLIIGGSLVALGLIVYAVWGAVISKAWKTQVAAIQKGREALAGVGKGALETFDRTMASDNSALRETLVTLTKKVDRIPPVGKSPREGTTK